eukprot:1225818-Prymnesium_polylepis.4
MSVARAATSAVLGVGSSTALRFALKTTPVVVACCRKAAIVLMYSVGEASANPQWEPGNGITRTARVGWCSRSRSANCGGRGRCRESRRARRWSRTGGFLCSTGRPVSAVWHSPGARPALGSPCQ